MTETRTPRPFGVVEGGRDTWLRQVGLRGSNEDMAEALRVLKQRADLREVKPNPTSEGS